MGTVYKIHPAIGIARVGNHPSAFFVGPETPETAGVEIDPDGNESTLTRYKDNGRIKRQAARFRVFRFQQHATGNLTLVGEVTTNEAKIEWRVDLCNRKAALDHSPAPEHPARPRNTDIADRGSLIIRNPAPVTIFGKNQPAKEFKGKFLGKPVYLGELRTDAAGRLLVLGGSGTSESVPPGQPMRDFANNDRWHDDVADGPVTAVVTLQGQDPVALCSMPSTTTTSGGRSRQFATATLMATRPLIVRRLGSRSITRRCTRISVRALHPQRHRRGCYQGRARNF
jgi:hypothetical protein